MSKNYTSEDIKTIEELIDHIRQNVGMYAGETDTPIHLFEECFTNALDEAIANYCNIIAVNMKEDNIYEILDNGRGIPIDNDVPISISTKFSGAKFKNSKSAYEITCLHGNTRLFLLDGSSMTISEMANSETNEFWGLSVTEDGKFVANRLYVPQVTGYTKKMVRVYLDNGEVEECTPDHLWMLRDGSYKQAIDLEADDSLMPCYFGETEDGHILIRPNYTYEYERNIKLERRVYTPLHKIVYESVFGKIPKFKSVHHKDLNKKNNIPSNFELLNASDHISLHGRVKFADTNPVGLIEYAKSEEGRRKSKEISEKYAVPALRRYTKTKKHRKQKSKIMSDYNNSVDQMYLQKCKVLKHGKYLLDNGYEINKENWKIDKAQRIPGFEKAINYFGSLENLIENIKDYNHKVVKTEIINYDTEIPVYDIHSPNYNNFVLESGSVVHNSGKHGVGLVVVNALSEWYKIEVYRDGKHATFEFENGKLKNKEIEDTNENPFSTKISFKPDERFFDKKEIDVNKIRERLVTASVEIDHCTLVLNNGNREVISHTREDYFKENCLNSDKHTTPVIHLCAAEKSEKFDVMFCYSLDGPLSQKIASSVNVLPVEDGGTHINILNNLLKSFFTTKAKKLGYKFQPQDCLVRLRSYLSLYLKQPDFGAQSKDKLTNKQSELEKLTKQLHSELTKYFNSNQELLEELLSEFQEYRKRIDSKRVKSNTGNSSKRASTKFTKLRDCSSRNGELFVVEGDSAAGSLVNARDPDIHAIFPLKGKIPSIANKKDILQNKEVNELMKVIGTGVEPNFNINDMRYERIICGTDADPDGNHIACLLTIIIYSLCPEIIKQGRYFLARTPLQAVNEKDNFIPLWTDEDYNKAVNDKRKITRFKGLGELEPWQIEKTLLDKDTRYLIPISYPQSDIMKYFSDINKRRELLNDDNIKFFE